MKKFINSLRYGSDQTRSSLLIIAVLSALTVILGVLAVIKLSFGFGAICVLAGVLDGIIMQSFTFEDEEALMERKEAAEGKRKGKKGKKGKKRGKEEGEDEDPTEAQGAARPAEDGDDEEPAASEPLGGKKEDDEEESDVQEESDGKKEGDKLTLTQEEILAETETEKEERPYDQYNKEKLNTIFHKYKVKEEHKRVIIDFCASYRVKQCPAYAWRDKKSLYFLLLEEEPRRIAIPLSKIDGIRYERGVVVKSSLDYEEFRVPSFVGNLFLPYLPTCYDRVRNERVTHVKNLYVIPPDLKVTNTSARNIFDILETDFLLSDSVMVSSQFDAYFKMAYKNSVLLRDRVITSEEYRERIHAILSSITESDMTEWEYQGLLNQMEEYKLITEEYGEYCRKEGFYRKEPKEPGRAGAR